MKYIRDNEADGVLERLLKAEIGRASRTGAPCSQFDPDLSAAYIERNLTPGETSRYEVHLASCSNCRIQVASMARAGYEAALDGVTAETAFFPNTPRVVSEIGPGLSRVWAYLLQPQWIAMGTAVLILLVAVPIFVILKNARPQPTSRRAPAASDSADASHSGQLDSFSAAQPSPSDSIASPNQLVSSPESKNQKVPAAEEVSSGNPGPGADETGLISKSGNAAPAPAVATTLDSPSRSAVSDKETASQRNQAEADRVSQTTQIAQNSPSQNQNLQRDLQQKEVDQVKVTAESGSVGQGQEKRQATDASAAPPSQDYRLAGKRAEQSAAAQISPREAQTLPDDKDKKAPEVTILRPGGGTSPDGTRPKEGKQTIRPNDAQPPKTESSREEPDRRAIASGPARKFATRGRSDADSVRKQSTSPPLARGQKLERRVENKRFRLQAGIWTDRDFKPAKEIPAVTLIRDGELYKSALEKQPGLEPLLAGFGPDERVVLVYKNIIYKIFPPKN